MSSSPTQITDIPTEKQDLLQLLLQQSGGEYNSFPLSFAQQRLWFLDQLEPGTATYNIASAVRLNGALQFSALEATHKEIVRRHEVLRTRFASVAGQPLQVIASSCELLLAVVALDHLLTGEREQEV